LKIPIVVGVPLIVIVSADQEAITPAGNPDGVPIPVAPVVVCVIAVNAVLTHKVGVAEGTVTILLGIMVIVPTAVMVLQPPVNGIE
jgi:hypothetical protein